MVTRVRVLVCFDAFLFFVYSFEEQRIIIFEQFLELFLRKD